MEENKFDFKKIITIIIYLLLILVYGGILSGYIGIITSIIYCIFLINEKKFSDKEKSIFNKIFYLLVFVGIVCIMII